MDKYDVKEDGKVFAIHLNKILSPYDNGIGYRALKLLIDGKRKSFYVHRLVAQKYLGDITGKVVNHIDGDKTNNHVSNLEICTQKENQIHAFKNGLLRGFIVKYYRGREAGVSQPS